MGKALELAKEIIDGRRITRDDELSLFLDCDLKELCEGADLIREHFIGDKVDLCSIINGRSGRCPEDCKYCAQSAHNQTDCEVYDFLPEEQIVEMCKLNESEGVDRFSIVTAGRALTGEEFDKAIHAFETMHRECKIDLCASMGFLDEEQLHRLHEAGVTFLGFGLSSERPAIGVILSESMSYLITGKWWLALFPGAALVLVTLGFQAIGQSLGRLMDPGSAHE